MNTRYNQWIYTMHAVQIAVLLPTKPSFNNDFGFKHGFRAEASLPLTQNAPAGPNNTTKLCWSVVVNLWECYIHTDIIKGLFWIISFIYIIPFV